VSARSPGTPRRYRFQTPQPAQVEPAGGWLDRPQTPPATRGAYATREGKAAASSTWGPRHAARLVVVRSLLSAGHVQRRWACNEESYTAGPCEGLKVRDAWLVAGRVADCCSRAVYHATAGGSQGGGTVAPERCGEKHVCPICAAAAAAKRAEGLAVVGAREGRPGALVSVVLTHRDQAPGMETLRQGWERFDAAYQRLRDRGNDHGRWLFANVYGGACCLETTTGSTGASWHPHIHSLVELQPGVDWETFREELAHHWEAVTSWAGSLSLFKVRGWDRNSGFGDEGAERWCELIDGPATGRRTSLEEAERLRSICYQVAKYPSPVADMENPETLAEFVTWARARKLTRWLGRWQAKEVQEWIREGVKYNAEEERQRRVRSGDAPDTGKVISGLLPVSVHQVDQAQGEHIEEVTIRFEDPRGGAPILRTAAELSNVRAWWRMAGVQHRLLPVLAELVTESHYQELELQFRALRKRADIPAALEAWHTLRSSQLLWKWTDHALNTWYATREREKRQRPDGHDGAGPGWPASRAAEGEDP